MKELYHSALTEELEIGKEIIQAKFNGDIVFRHDITCGLPGDFNRCDILYSEPSWLQGYSKFINRAGKETSNYNQYLASLSEIIETADKPIWIILGAHAYSRIPKPDRTLNIQLHNYRTTVLGWNDDTEYSFKTNYDFITELARTYNCVGDFCCGYGNTGKIFKEHNKSFVMSDINGKCVYQVAKELMGYEKASA